MHLRWTDAAATDLERIADYLFSHAPELRVDVGPGYRVYFTRRGRTVVVLLAGGSKQTQAADIKAALQLARGLSE